MSPPDSKVEPAEAGRQSTASGEAPEHRLTVLLFTDLLNSSGLKTRLGDVAYATAIARPHNQLFRSTLARFARAREVNYTGDGFLAIFQGVADAVEAALLFHHALRTHPWVTEAVQTRIGIHLGETIFLGEDTGGGLTIASHAADMCARVMSLGAGGQTLLTRHAFDDARQYVRAHPALPEGGEPPALEWAAHGPYLFKGKEDPLEVFEVGAVGFAPLTPPPDAEKARRAVRPGEEETLGWRPAQGIAIPGKPGWKIVEKIGEGGFGEVWLAEQSRMRQRRVFKFCFDEERLRTFKRELTLFRLIRDALGDRADIARLYDVKLDAPPFFLESEFAEHGNLVEWCDRQGGVAQVPLPRRLELVAGVAEAVAAAHSIGILHKDLKPQNILMQAHAGGEPQPQLADFGIGALADRGALDAHAITAAGFTVNTLPGSSSSGGTRLYAPPEQLTGRPYTVQGDIYALGVMLFQMVVADFSRALAAGWERDVGDELLREDIADCVDGDPARRLTSAAELAERLRSLERRHATREKKRLLSAKNDRRRHLTRLALAGAAVSVVVAIGLGAGFWRERNLRHRAREAEAQALAATRLARERLAQGEKARDAAESLVSEAVFSLREKLAPIGKVSVLEDMATAAEQYYAELPRELMSPTARGQMVRLHLNRALIGYARSDDDAVTASALRAITAGREVLQVHPDDANVLSAVGDSLALLAFLRHTQELPEEARAFADELLKLAETWLAREPESAKGLQLSLLVQVHRLLQMREGKVDPVRGLALLGKCQSIAGRMKLRGGESIETCFVDTLAQLGKAALLEKIGDPAATQAAYEEADTGLAQGLARFGEHPFVRQFMLDARWQGLKRRGVIAARTEQRDLLRELLGRFIAMAQEREKMVEQEPARLESWKSLAEVSVEIGGRLLVTDGTAAALPWVEKGFAAGERAAASNYERSGVSHVRLVARFKLAQILRTTMPEGWENQVLEELFPSAVEIFCTPARRPQPGIELGAFRNLLNVWREIAEQLDSPGQAERTVESLRTISRAWQRASDRWPATVSLYLDRIAHAERARQFLLSRSQTAAATEFSELRGRLGHELAGRFPDDLHVIADRVDSENRKAVSLVGLLKGCSADRKPAAFADAERLIAATLQYLESKRHLLPESTCALYAGGCHSLQGAALLAMGRFIDAEAILRTAVQERVASLEVADLVERRRRAWDRCESEGLLGEALCALGRADDGRRLLRSCAEGQEKLAREEPRGDRFQGACQNWRRAGSFHQVPGEAAGRLELESRAVKLARDASRLMGPPVAHQLRIEVADSLLVLATTQRETGDLKESNTSLLEALSTLRDVPTSDFPARLHDRATLTLDIATMFVSNAQKLQPPTDPRRQVDQAHEYFRRLDADRSLPEWGRIRSGFEKLRAELPPAGAEASR